MRDQIWQIRRVLRITSENICAFAKEKKRKKTLRATEVRAVQRIRRPATVGPLHRDGRTTSNLAKVIQVLSIQNPEDLDLEVYRKTAVRKVTAQTMFVRPACIRTNLA